MLLLASDIDVALHISKAIHGDPRAGYIKRPQPGIAMARRMISVDVSAVPEDRLGHSYFADELRPLIHFFILGVLSPTSAIAPDGLALTLLERNKDSQSVAYKLEGKMRFWHKLTRILLS